MRDAGDKRWWTYNPLRYFAKSEVGQVAHNCVEVIDPREIAALEAAFAKGKT
jgi:hypothetical protein